MVSFHFDGKITLGAIKGIEQIRMLEETQEMMDSEEKEILKQVIIKIYTKKVKQEMDRIKNEFYRKIYTEVKNEK